MADAFRPLRKLRVLRLERISFVHEELRFLACLPAELEVFVLELRNQTAGSHSALRSFIQVF